MGSSTQVTEMRALLILIVATLSHALPEDIARRKKAIGIFNVVSFPNIGCIGSGSLNGTCYTTEECASRDGVSSGSCADGFGVCCVITLACGGTTSENCTYLSQSASNSPAVNADNPETCSYTICPISSTISRIRLDLTMFDIAPPNPPASTLGAAAGTVNTGASIGHCLIDTFSVSGAPTICGLNNGQHMIVDNDGSECITATFAFSGSANSRNYQIHVLQYDRSDSDNLAGPPGCLQWMMGDDGTVTTFNWQGVGTAAGGAVSTHLANQDYNICVRQNANFCYICWTPTVRAAGATAAGTVPPGTFGISNGLSNGATGKNGVDADCPSTAANLAAGKDSNDYIIINGAAQSAANMLGADAAAVLNNAATFSRFCGRHLSATMAGEQIDQFICTKTTPFMVGVHFDGAEGVQAAGVAETDTNEAADGATAATYDTDPLGTIGFSLNFQQWRC